MPSRSTNAFEAAASQLHVTPSAVSQRVKAMEQASGRCAAVLAAVEPGIAAARGSVVGGARRSGDVAAATRGGPPAAEATGRPTVNSELLYAASRNVRISRTSRGLPCVPRWPPPACTLNCAFGMRSDVCSNRADE
ncbi:MAG: LysR family transcriptional regulator [Salinibacterium sp.]|nr:LysR family transcriptional regulator [Salinibacterium sp.]